MGATRAAALAAAAGAASALALALAAPAQGQTGSVRFTDVAANDGAGISYRRGPGVDEARAEARFRETPYTSEKMMMETPAMTRLVGVAVLDYDNDGRPDILVANGPTARGNPQTGPGVSLYRNTIGETGALAFKDVSTESGLREATRGMNAAGVSYADVDNDGCEDLLFTGDNEANKLFHQTRTARRCTGTFEDVSARSGLAQSGHHTAASFGDVNGDGLVDLVIAEGWHRQNSMPCFEFTPTGEGIGRNRLYLNRGKMRFKDVSAASGIQANTGFRDHNGPRPDLDGLPTITWATTIVDYDGDGRQDVLFADDQCGLIPARHQEKFPKAKLIDRGFIQVFRNTGNGKFANVTTRVGTDRIGAWMGFALGDFDFNNRLDFFSTSFGDYMGAEGHRYPYELGDTATRAFYGQPNGTFSDPGAGERVKATTFGWGTSTFDYDNDGCTDVMYVGSLDMIMLVDRSNPGTLLRNLCGSQAGQFEWDQQSYPPSPGKLRHQDMGLATGDLDGNGAPDVVSVSAERIPDDVPPTKSSSSYAAQADPTAFFFMRLMPADSKKPLWPIDKNDHEMPSEWMFAGWSPEDGRLRVETNSGNSNGWIKVRTVGMKGIARNGRVNRDGIGALVKVTPAGGRTAAVPVLGGSSFLSQHDRTLGFGLGAAPRATVEVVWPGGTRNRVYDVARGETLVLPEIPCRFDRRIRDRRVYVKCVARALKAANQAGTIDLAQRVRLKRNAIAAYDETNPKGRTR